MKHSLAALLAVAVLSGCGAAQQAVETPQQVVSAASNNMARLHSAKFDMTATVLEQFPPALAQSLGAQGAALANLSIDLSAKGSARFPNQESMAMTVKTGSVTINTAMVFTGGKIYLKDPQSGNFAEVPGANAFLQFSNQSDPLSGTTILKTAQSIKDLGDTTVNGVAVHHYQIVPDKSKLAEQGSTSQARELMRSTLQNGTIVVEAWIGKDDHLLHRLKQDTDATVDLNQAMQATGQPLPPGVSLPSGATAHAVVNATIDYHDFNAPVTVSVPPVAPS